MHRPQATHMLVTQLQRQRQGIEQDLNCFPFGPFFFIDVLFIFIWPQFCRPSAHTTVMRQSSGDVDSANDFSSSFFFFSFFEPTRNKNNARRVSGLSSTLPAELINVFVEKLCMQELDEFEIHSLEGPTSERCLPCARLVVRPCARVNIFRQR